MDEFKKENHESYGIAGFSRVSGGARSLFGSSIKHNDTIELSIKTAELQRGLSHDWYHGRNELIRIEMSRSQFAELITSMNCGDGIPVTILKFNGKSTESCPFKDKTEEHLDEFNDANKNINDNANRLIEEAAEIFQKKNITKADREHCLKLLRSIKQDIGVNSEFRFKSFQEQMDKTKQEAKGEIEAFYENKMLSIAQKALVENKEKIEQIQNPITVE